MRCPSTHNRTVLAVTIATPSAATATGLGDANRVLMVMCTSAFNILFSDGDDGSTVADPANNSLFAAQTAYPFELNKTNTHFKVTAAASGSFEYFWAERA